MKQGRHSANSHKRWAGALKEVRSLLAWIPWFRKTRNGLKWYRIVFLGDTLYSFKAEYSANMDWIYSKVWVWLTMQLSSDRLKEKLGYQSWFWHSWEENRDISLNLLSSTNGVHLIILFWYLTELKGIVAIKNL